MVEEIEAAYRVATPLFCSGASTAQAELRPASFKGVLRFWWRALAWSRYQGDLKRIHGEEEKLFGSASHGRGKVTLQLVVDGKDELRKQEVCPPAVLRTGAGAGAPVIGAGARYLGYGLMGTAGELTRACLRAPLEFTARLRCRDLEREERVLLRDALRALGTLGGLGARTRRGYGSLVLRTLRIPGEEWRPPEHIERLAEEIRSLHLTWPGEAKLPEYTALSKRARYVLLTGQSSQLLELLDLLGREMVRFRSWGHHGKILGNVAAEGIFTGDHDLMRKMRPKERRTHPRRIVFGLPHNYGKQAEDKVEPAGKNLERRASPLFIHAHECGMRPVLVLAFLPAVFLPSEHGAARVKVGGKSVSLADEAQLWKPIDEFLERLLHTSKEHFESRQEVRP
jgi:CRISPR-associated protein Cmr1